LKRGFSGLEFFVGIPGTLGGAVVMNAGWRGDSISKIVKKVTAFHPEEGVREFSNEECRFTYRGSRFRGGEDIILEAEFELEECEASVARGRIKSILAERKKKFPLQYPSAGSVFKNPPGDYAGRLIEAAGLKGKRVGDAEISEKHANFIINRGKARAKDVLDLIDLARSAVKEKFGVDLELEIEIWK